MIALGIVGILVDGAVFRKIRSGKTGSEKIRLYNRAAEKHGLTPLYMCLERTVPASKQAYGYRYVQGRYVFGKYPIPAVIHNRTLPKSGRMRRRLERLASISHVFNARNRYAKLKIHRLLQKRFARHLPVTARYSRDRLRSMMSRFRSLYVKPQSSSVGKGIMKVSLRKDGRWSVQLPHRSVIANRPQAEANVDAAVKRRSYLIQQSIPLAKFGGRIYDIRVTVQRGAAGSWQATGMYGKVARAGSHVTNVARGGKAMKCRRLFQTSFRDPSRVEHAVRSVSLDIARHLGRKLDRLADVGLDMGVDGAGKPYFIEMNGRDQRYGFQKAKMPDTFYRTYETPMLYAKYLLRKKRGKGRG